MSRYQIYKNKFRVEEGQMLDTFFYDDFFLNKTKSLNAFILFARSISDGEGMDSPIFQSHA
jgi:hypothetical protein